MSIQKINFEIGPEQDGKRLDHALFECLNSKLKEQEATPLSRSKIRILIIAGAVYLNRKRVRIASRPIRKGARIEVHLDLDKLPQAKLEKYDMKPEDILFEDEDLIFVSKPAVLPTQPTLDEARDNLFGSLRRFLSTRDGADPYLGLHHRLDRDTSGVLLFSKTRRVNFELGLAFKEHRIEKSYLAITEKPRSVPPKTWTKKNYLLRKSGKKSIMQQVHSGGDFAETEFELLETFPDALLIRAKPKTGRMHQIRVHLAGAQMPILGDLTYGARPRREASRVMLHSDCLTLEHPIHKTRITVTCDPPGDFQECLKQLRNRSTKNGVRS